MKSQPKTKALKLVEKYDHQLREILSEELKALRAAKTQIIELATNSSGLLTA